ncbi:MAG: ureidoglycolate lyase [Planctomycetota bacterium]|jgi:ureidoglycolate lyase
MVEIRIKLQPLTKEAFADFGDVIELEGARHFPINVGTIERYHDLAQVDVDVESGGRALISIMQCTKTSQLPYQIKVIERHPNGSQAFIPMTPVPMVVAVGAPGENPDPEKLQAFISNGRQGVNYRAGVWHMPLISEIEHQQYLIVDRGGPGQNCDELDIENQNITIYE